MAGGGLLFDQRREKAGLTAFTIFPGARAGFHRAIDHRELLRASPAERVHAAGLAETLAHAPVHRAQSDTLAELAEIAGWSCFALGGDTSGHRARDYVLA